MKTRTQLRLLGSATALLCIAGLAPSALAQETAEPRHNEPFYALEIEPHFTFGAENVYGATGFGAGLRVSVPLVYGHVGNLPDNLAISFGGDILHYDNCYYANNCGANYLILPVAAQWNVYVVRKFSLFLEGGVFVYDGWFQGCDVNGGPGCNEPSSFGLLPTLAIGGRIHVGDDVAFTMRLGYPTTTLGLSFL